MLYGYFRAATPHDAAVERTWLVDNGVPENNVFEDLIDSVLTEETPGFRQLLRILSPRDTLHVRDFARIAGSTRRLLAILNDLRVLKVNVNVGGRHYDPATTDWNTLIDTLNHVIVLDDQLAAMTKRMSDRHDTYSTPARPGGRKPKLDASQKASLQRMVKEKKHTQEQIAGIFGVSVSTVRRIANDETA